MRFQQKAITLLGVLLVLGFAATMLGQKANAGRNSSIQLYAEFRDLKDQNNVFIDKMHSDGKGLYFSANSTPSYPNDVYLTPDGQFYMRIQKDRTVVFEFNSPSRPVPTDAQGHVLCHEYGAIGFEPFTLPAPAFLRNNTGIPNNDFTRMATLGEFTYAAGQWVYSSLSFNLAKMPVGPTPAYVALNIGYNIVEQDEPLIATFNYKLWGGSNPYTGIVKITHPDSFTWLLEPLPTGDSTAPIPALGPNETSLALMASAVKRVHGGGYCDLGDWRMPFQLTLTRR